MKTIIIALFLLAGNQTQADAQFLKKLGKALDKVAAATESLTQKANTTQTTNADEDIDERLVGKPVKVGVSTVSTHGDNQGLVINWLGAERIKGSDNVTVHYQLINQAGLTLNVSMGSAGKQGGTYLLDQQGRKYSETLINMGGLSMRYDNGCEIAADTKIRCSTTFENVPNTVNNLQMAYLSYSLTVGSETWGHGGSFRIKDIPIRQLPIINAKGIFGETQVRLGDKIASLPKTFDGLYDTYTIGNEDFEGETYQVLTFTLNGKETMSAISYDNQTIDYIIVKSPNVYCLIHKRYYTCGSNIDYEESQSDFSMNDYGCPIYNGMTFNKELDENGETSHIMDIRIGVSPL